MLYGNAAVFYEGATWNLLKNCFYVGMNAGLVANGYINMPAGASDGDSVSFCTLGGITSFGVFYTGGSVVGAPATLAALGVVRFSYRAVVNKWYRTG
ncbi:MAG: hypothetical protein ACOYBP_09185 [Microbacteriaceae bacterium]